MQKAFICTNKKQMLGARLSKFSIERALPPGNSFAVELIIVESMSAFQKFEGASFNYEKERRTYTFNDLQSFTLTRFMPPELMNYDGEAFVIDPDIFALTDPTPLFSYLNNAAIAACRKRDAWDTSVMVLSTNKLRHWKTADMLSNLKSGARNYVDYMELRGEEARIAELPRLWNTHDKINTDTKMLHTTYRLTQPWKTGLRVDFTRTKLPKLFGIIPREPLLWILGRYPLHYQPHPDKKVEEFFFQLVKDALKAGAVTLEDIQSEIAAGHIRTDLLEKIK